MIVYGGDYNPEQWDESVWSDDIELMKEAQVNLVSIGIFSWALLEPREGEFDFGWLDRIMDKLHEGGIRVDLATSTASPPPWLIHKYPKTLPIASNGVRLGIASRQHYCPSSPDYRRLAARITQELAQRYAAHPALAMWHVNNEYGCHVSHCYCDVSAGRFREWLAEKYGTIETLNSAWGTAFWSQTYGDFHEVWTPSESPTFRNPAQLLDFDRFSSDELLELYKAEATIVKGVTPHIPVTTNFMGFFKGADYWEWAKHVDVVSDDSYPDPVDPRSPAFGAMTRDLMRSLRGGQPWLLMEQSTSAVNWRSRNAAKIPGQMAAWSTQAIARGADGIMFFQWRQSVSGAEKFHSAMLPHAGTNSRVWREVVRLGADLAGLGGVQGTRVRARVAIVFDWDSWWSIEQSGLPTKLNYVDGVFSWYQPLFNRDVAVEFVRAADNLTKFDVVIVPSLFSASSSSLENLSNYALGGGHLIVSYQTGIVDEKSRITEGSYLGVLQKTLGIKVEEFAPLAPPDLAATSREEPPTVGLAGDIFGQAVGHLWAEYLQVHDASVEASFSSGVMTGWPAITRRDSAFYVATQPEPVALDALLTHVLDRAGVPYTEASLIESVVRGDYLFTINHETQEVSIKLDGPEIDDRPKGGNFS